MVNCLWRKRSGATGGKSNHRRPADDGARSRQRGVGAGQTAAARRPTSGASSKGNKRGAVTSRAESGANGSAEPKVANVMKSHDDEPVSEQPKFAANEADKEIRALVDMLERDIVQKNINIR